MKFKAVKIFSLFFACNIVLINYGNTAVAQTLKYSSENVFINNPTQLQFVANIDGNQHLLSFNNNEDPELFIFDADLEFRKKVMLPFRFPEKSMVKIIPVGKFYYLHIHPWLSQKHFFWKIDAEGNCTDYNAFFQNLLASQAYNIKLGFQLIPYKGSLLMVYHTALDNLEKNTVIIAETDSMLHVVFTTKVLYDFKRDEERLEKEILVFGKYLLVLKTAQSGTSLEVMKVNLNTSYAVSNTFASSGYFYSQVGLGINNQDSSFTVSALLTQPTASENRKQFVFVSRLNKFLVEEVPFAILKDQFKKNTGTGFMLVDAQSEWMKFRVRGEQRNNSVAGNSMNLYQDLTMSDNNTDGINDLNRLLQKTESGNAASSSWDGYGGIRFSLLNQGLKIVKDSLVKNTKDSYTLKADQFINFKCKQKEYLLLRQQFLKRSRGLLLIHADEANGLLYTDIRVADRNDYLLMKSCQVPGEGIIIPYIYKLEAGLVKITIN